MSCLASSTTPDPDDRYRRVRVTHPFHPLYGRDFEFVAHRHNWGEDRFICMTRTESCSRCQQDGPMWRHRTRSWWLRPCMCRKFIRAGERRGSVGPGSGLRGSVRRGNGHGEVCHRGMMCDCADATGLLDGGQHIRGPGPSSRDRSGQEHRDLGSPPPGRGAGAPAGREEGALQPCGPGLAGGAAAPAKAARPRPDALAGMPRHGAALAP